MKPLRLRIEPADAPASEQVLTGESALVGRASNAEVMVADTLVSRQHARFSRRADAWWVEDLGARNRTYVNDQVLTSPVAVRVGDVVKVGETTLRVLAEPERPTGVDAGSGKRLAPVFVKTSVPLPPSALETEGSGHAARLKLLNEVHHALARAIALPDLLDLILERCFAVLRPEQGVILLDAGKGELTRVASRSLPGETEDLSVARRIVEEVAGKGQSALVLDAAQDARFADSESIVGTGIRSVVAAPLLDASGTLGMIALYSRISVRRFSADDLSLLESLAAAAALRVRNIALAEEAAARRVLEHELTLAHDIQMSMTPRQMPELAGLEIAGRLQPARSVGGDLYDVLVDGRGRVWTIVADVSGKGVAASLYMAVARTLFRALAPGASSLAEVVTRMNIELCRDNDRDMFVTALVGLVDPAEGTVALCDAGHNPPVVLRREGVAYRPALIKSIVLGVRPEAAYHETPLLLEPGDMLVAYTDGITEARNVEGEAFDLPRLERSLATLVHEPIDRVVAGLVHTVEQFTGGALPEDDIAVLAVRLKT